jgi:hypothetical protein
MGRGVKSIHEYTQDKCLHQLDPLDPKKYDGFKYCCRLCGRFMKRKNGIVRAASPVPGAEPKK